MDKGTLVEFKVQSDRKLAVVDRPDGKTRWFVVDERGTSHSLTPRQVTYSVPGQTYKATEIPKFLKEVQFNEVFYLSFSIDKRHQSYNSRPFNC